ncbi:hypothetical protein ACTJI2_13595 [Pseudoxanthomonas sp. 22568]|uniref:hypothetical protein n=1 Tax=Pseudoxanthomonas sp. 22568 TaxID=3453945 RepID=UPI003F876EEF
MQQFPLLPRELTPESVLCALQGRRGAANGATARDLVFIITGKVSGAEERRLRQIIEKLRCDGHPICAHPALGYHFAATASELEATCMFLTRRMVTTGRQVAAMNRVAMPDFYGQLGLPQPTDDEEIEQ